MIESTAAFERLLEYLYQSHGFDFTGYKRTTLMRRVHKRIDELNLKSDEEYLDHLQVHPEEFGVLFDTILINVTAFFRDPQAWAFLQSTVMPRILAARGDVDNIRVWSAGCASGEEAYTLAIVFCEALGMDGFRRRVKIYATDVDEDALQRARQGSYTLKQLQGVPEALREKYFDIHGQRAAFRPDLRRSVIFGRHDLVQDAPISRLDLLVTRNTLMYFTSEAQNRILLRLHYALNDTGFLFLGRAEMLLSLSNLFAPLDMRHRMFTKMPRLAGRDRLALGSGDRLREPPPASQREARLRELAFDIAPAAQLVLDREAAVVAVNQAARDMFGLASKDLGRLLQDLEVSYRPTELRSRLDEAQKERHAVVVSDVERHLDEGRVQFLEIVVSPLLDEDGSYMGATVAFLDVTSEQLLRTRLQRSKQELETAYEELQSTNEELETTNEELQSTVEELETTNEELQSANEELETMNEELQVTNGELQTINIELRERGVEMDRLSIFMDSVLRNLRVAVAVVDRELCLQVWNSRAEDMWGVRSDEVIGHSLMSLDIGLPLDEMAVPLRRCLSGESDGEDRTITALNRRGRTIACRVTVSPLIDRRAVEGAVVLMEQVGEVSPAGGG
jgi:two-component system, chemotaxis family, CheB/CheR fusion protein